jgi:repressor of nif and glnA expression
MKDLEERSAGVYRASAGTVYPTLQQLEDEGLLRSNTRDGRRLYTLTEAGLAELDRNRDQVSKIWNRTTSRAAWPRWCGPEGAMVAAAGAMVLKSALSAVKHTGGDPEVALKLRDTLDRVRREIESLIPASANH